MNYKKIEKEKILTDFLRQKLKKGRIFILRQQIRQIAWQYCKNKREEILLDEFLTSNIQRFEKARISFCLILR